MPGRIRRYLDALRVRSEMLHDYRARAEELVGLKWEMQKLLEASMRVPVKQHDRSQDEQQRVESFTTAIVSARKALRREPIGPWPCDHCPRVMRGPHDDYCPESLA